MRKTVRIALPAIVIGLLAWAGWRALHDQPYYRGKPLQAWLQQYGDAVYAHEKQGRQDAEAALRHIGTNALPTLLVWISKRDSALEKALRAHLRWSESTWDKIPFLGGASRSRGRAIQACGVLGPIAKPMVPSLANLLRDTDWRVRACVMCALAQIGPAAEDAVPALLQSLGDPTLDHVAFGALPAIGAKPEAIMPTVIRILSSTNSHQQMSAVWLLAEYGTNAKVAGPNLVRFLNDRDPSLRYMATNALLKIVPEAAAEAGIRGVR